MEMEIESERKNQSESIGELAKALAIAQGEFDRITAERTGQEGHRKYKYADLASFLAAVRRSLSSQELAVIQRPSAVDSLVQVETLIVHSSGEWISSFLAIQAGNNTPKGIGSAITYARRYSLGAMLGLAPDEDDDGTLASKPQGQQVVKKAGSQGPKCSELERQRLIRCARDLNWPPEKMGDVIAKKGAKKIADLTSAEARSLAELLEKKFLKQQAEEAFSPDSDGQK